MKCVRCKAEAVQGLSQCQFHRDYAKNRRKLYRWDGATRKARHEAGICYDCELPVMSGKTRCAAHLSMNTKQTIKYKKTNENGKVLKKKLDALAKKRWRRSSAHRYSYVKSAVLRDGKTWELTKEQFHDIIAKPCYYCGLFHDIVAGRGMDRLDNSKGYSIDNVVSCCRYCNYARGDRFTVEETKIIGMTIRQIMLTRKLNCDQEDLDILAAAAQAIEPMWPIAQLPPPVLRFFNEYHKISRALRTLKAHENRSTDGT